MIAARVARADGFWERLIGLIGKRRLEADEGLWLIPCNGAHTFGMRFPIDLLLLDPDLRVLRVVPNLKPCRVCLPVRRGYSTVELPAGTLAASDVRVGDELLCDADRREPGGRDQKI